MPALLFDTEEELQKFIDELPVISDDGDQQDFYVKARLDGQSHLFAEMCAYRQPPGTGGTDRAFLEGQIGRYQGNEVWLNNAKAKYKRATGHDLPQGMVYISQLAKHPGDPKAWVSDLSDAARRARELGHGVEALKIRPQEVGPVIRRKMAPDILQGYLRKAVANPENIGKNVNDLKEQIVDKHGYDSKNLQLGV